MDREFYTRPGLSKNPDYQKGLEFGSQALDPLSVVQSTETSSITGRKEFLAGYAVALENYLEGRGVVLPVGTGGRLKYDIDFRSFLFGVVIGLRRDNPNKSTVFEFQGSGEPDDSQTWSDTLRWIHDDAKGDGYIIGFLAGLARDYDIITHGHAIPTNNGQYPVYLDGLKAKPSKYFFIKGDKSLGAYAEAEYNKRIYLTGLKVWLHEQGFNTVCPVLLTHPNTLTAFHEFINTGNMPESEDPSFEVQIGYELAQRVLSERNKQQDIPDYSI